jgi:hypothetical protein
MAEHFKSVKTRRDEMRGAAYFGRKAFATMDGFADALQENGKFVIVEKYKAQGIPTMYHA